MMPRITKAQRQRQSAHEAFEAIRKDMLSKQNGKNATITEVSVAAESIAITLSNGTVIEFDSVRLVY